MQTRLLEVELKLNHRGFILIKYAHYTKFDLNQRMGNNWSRNVNTFSTKTDKKFVQERKS